MHGWNSLDVFLLIEVSDTTIKHDREEKIPLYATDGIVESWLIDLNEFQVEVYLIATRSVAEGIPKRSLGTRKRFFWGEGL
jgi:hypothetical protein